MQLTTFWLKLILTFPDGWARQAVPMGEGLLDCQTDILQAFCKFQVFYSMNFLANWEGCAGNIPYPES